MSGLEPAVFCCWVLLSVGVIFDRSEELLALSFLYPYNKSRKTSGSVTVGQKALLAVISMER